MKSILLLSTTLLGTTSHQGTHPSRCLCTSKHCRVLVARTSPSALHMWSAGNAPWEAMGLALVSVFVLTISCFLLAKRQGQRNLLSFIVVHWHRLLGSWCDCIDLAPNSMTHCPFWTYNDRNPLEKTPSTRPHTLDLSAACNAGTYLKDLMILWSSKTPPHPPEKINETWPGFVATYHWLDFFGLFSAMLSCSATIHTSL